MMKEDPRLSNLLTYTTFHLGVYISLVTAIIGVGLLNVGINILILRWSAGWILVAGMFGGVVGSNITEVHNYRRLRREDLEGKKG
jgi:putative Mn2+ efflux pump MntP